MNVSITGFQFLTGIGLIALVIMGIIMAIRYHYSHVKINKKVTGKRAKKYEEVDVFKLSNMFWKVGIISALSVTILAFAWTSFPKEIDVSDYQVNLVDIEVEPPSTVQKKVLPPPPPPPTTVIQTTDDLKIQAPKFVDQTVTHEMSNQTATPAAKKAKPKPKKKRALPPPKKVVEEVEKIHVIVEEMPRFPGCEHVANYAESKQCADKKMLEFIYKNIKYPTIARENNVQGTAVVTFVIEKDGSISNIEIIRDAGAECGTEAVRVVEMMQNLPQKWLPGRQGNENVRVRFNLPVKFRLDNP
ncbi:MAG: energy transducer TonB [Saprospiraceae bacterium]